MLKRLFEKVLQDRTPDFHALPVFDQELRREIGEHGAPQAEDDTAIVARLAQDGLLGHLDWRDDFDAFLAELAPLLSRKSLPPLDPAEQDRIEASGDLPDMLASASAMIEARSQTLLMVDTNSDQYMFAVVSPDFFRRWIDTRLSQDVFTTQRWEGGGPRPKRTEPRDLGGPGQ